MMSYLFYGYVDNVHSSPIFLYIIQDSETATAFYAYRGRDLPTAFQEEARLLFLGENVLRPSEKELSELFDGFLEERFVQIDLTNPYR